MPTISSVQATKIGFYPPTGGLARPINFETINAVEDLVKIVNRWADKVGFVPVHTNVQGIVSDDLARGVRAVAWFLMSAAAPPQGAQVNTLLQAMIDRPFDALTAQPKDGYNDNVIRVTQVYESLYKSLFPRKTSSLLLAGLAAGAFFLFKKKGRK